MIVSSNYLHQIWLTSRRFGQLLSPSLFVMLKVNEGSETSVSTCNWTLMWLIARNFGTSIRRKMSDLSRIEELGGWTGFRERQYGSTIPYPQFIYPKSSENPKVSTHATHVVGVR
jgi:hypothetical protein